MRPHRVVVLDVLTKHPPQMPFVDGDDVIEALAPERPDHPLGDGVGVRRVQRSQNRLDPDPSSACDEVPAIATVAVSDEEPWLLTPGGRLDHLPPDPGRDRVLRDVPEECCDKQTEVEHRRASRGSPILCYLRTELHLSGFAVPRRPRWSRACCSRWLAASPNRVADGSPDTGAGLRAGRVRGR